jgi:hypothetical protein
MLSSVLLSYLKDNGVESTAGIQVNTSPESTHTEDDDGNSSDCGQEPEPVHIRIETNKAGQVVETNQVHNYLHHEPTLAHMCFYDFCQCVQLQTKARSKGNKYTHEDCLRVLHRHGLKHDHPLSDTHKLLEHTNESWGECHHEYVPRVVGMSISQRTHTKQWALFCLMHFKPFSHTEPLLPQGKSTTKVYETYDFGPCAQMVMHNWEAVHECKDERDAERLHKQARMTTPKKLSTLGLPVADDDDNFAHSCSTGRSTQEDFHINQYLLLLTQSHWLSYSTSSMVAIPRS